MLESDCKVCTNVISAMDASMRCSSARNFSVLGISVNSDSFALAQSASKSIVYDPLLNLLRDLVLQSRVERCSPFSAKVSDVRLTSETVGLQSLILT